MNRWATAWGWCRDRLDLIVACAAGAAGIAVAYRPVLALIVLAPVVAYLVVVRPKAMLGVATLLVAFMPTLAVLPGLSSATYIDEAAVIMAFVAALLHRLGHGQPLRGFPGLRWFVAFLALGLLSGIVAHVSPAILLYGAFVAAKGALFALAVAQFDWTASDLRTGALCGAVFGFVIIFGVALNAVIGPSWTITIMGYSEDRFGGTALVGPFTHPLVLGNVAALIVIAAQSWRLVFGSSRANTFLLVGMMLAGFASLRRTAMAGMLCGWVYVAQRVNRVHAVLSVVLIALAAVSVFWAVLTEIVAVTYSEYVLQNESAARDVLTFGAIDVAHKYFPLGAGFGRYGSSVAAENYSPEYVILGFPDIWGVSNQAGTGMFLNDTAWPAIVGESGWLGTVCFVLCLASAWRALGKLINCTGVFRWLGLTGRGWFVSLLLASIAVPVFASPPFFIILFGLGALAAHVVSEQARPSSPEHGQTAPDAQETAELPTLHGAPTTWRIPMVRLRSGRSQSRRR